MGFGVYCVGAFRKIRRNGSITSRTRVWRLTTPAARRVSPVRLPAVPAAERLGLLVALALVTLVAGAQTVRLWQAARSGPVAPQMRLEITTPSSSGTRVPGELESLAISPDGLKVAFVTVSEGRSQLWLRPIDSASARPLAGTELAVLPFWSPDSRSIGFFANNELKRIDIEGGSTQDTGPCTVWSRRRLEPRWHDSLRPDLHRSHLPYPGLRR